MDVLRAEIDKREIAVVMALHDLSLAGRYCDRLALMSNGAIAAEGAPADVLTPANLREAFEVETFVESDPVTGRPQVSLLGPAGGYTSVEEKGVIVHVVCGAGSGRGRDASTGQRRIHRYYGRPWTRRHRPGYGGDYLACHSCPLRLFHRSTTPSTSGIWRLINGCRRGGGVRHGRRSEQSS